MEVALQLGQDRLLALGEGLRGALAGIRQAAQGAIWQATSTRLRMAPWNADKPTTPSRPTAPTSAVRPSAMRATREKVPARGK